MNYPRGGGGHDDWYGSLSWMAGTDEGEGGVMMTGIDD